MSSTNFVFDRNIGKNEKKRNKYKKKFLDYGELSATDTLKTASKRAIAEIAEATGSLIGNKIDDKISKSHQRIIQK